MSEKHIGMHIGAPPLRMTEEDWRKVEALTDEEIETAIADDPDAQFPDDPELWKNARMVAPDGLWLKINPEMLEWYRGRHIPLEPFMLGVLKRYMESHRNA